MSRRYPSVVERYFQKYYHKKNDRCEDICILAHSNNICLVTLAPTHVALSEGSIKSVSYEFGNQTIDKVVSGKKKHGAFKVNPKRPICQITTELGNTYTITTGISGKLIEVNKNLLTDPGLVSRKPESLGYLAVILHKYVGPGGKICQDLQEHSEYIKSLGSCPEVQSDISEESTTKQSTEGVIYTDLSHKGNI